MRAQGLVALLSAALFGRALAEDATPVSNNPVGVVYKATLPDKPFFTSAALDGNVKGYISAEAPASGNGVRYTVRFENLPKEGGPFLYHLHVDPAANGNCTSTLAHLDPFSRGEATPCDASNPASCQVGDLSGKYGKITTDPFSVEYIDPFTSTREGLGSFFGNRSFVLHFANKTRLTCANFAKLDVVVKPNNTWSGATGAPTASATSPGYSTYPTPPTVPFDGAGSVNKLSVSLLGSVAAAMLLVL